MNFHASTDTNTRKSSIPILILMQDVYRYRYQKIHTNIRCFLNIDNFFFCILEIVHYFLSNKPSDLLTQSDWSRPQLCRKIMYKYVVLLTLINATYFYYYLTQGGRNHPPPFNSTFVIDFVNFVFTGA